MTPSRVRPWRRAGGGVFLGALTVCLLALLVMPAHRADSTPSTDPTIPGDEGISDPESTAEWTRVSPADPRRTAWWPYLGRGLVACTYNARVGEVCRVGYHPWPAIDVALPAGHPIRAGADGVVESSRFVTTPGAPAAPAGRYVVIAHEPDRAGVYKHLAEVLVRPGQSVVAGQVIGIAGRSAAATYHLHYDEQSDTGAINSEGNRIPLPVLWAGRSGEVHRYPDFLGVSTWDYVDHGTEVVNDYVGSPPVTVHTATEFHAALDAAGTAGTDAGATIEVHGPIDLGLSAVEPVYAGSDMLRIVGVPGTGAELRGDGVNRLLRVDSTAPVELDGLSLRGGRSSGDGGAISSTGPVTVIESQLDDNAALGDGGAIAAESVAFVRSTLTANRADGSGGAVAAGSVLIHSSTIAGNDAGVDGGGLLADSLQATMSTISDNSASGSGGGVAAAEMDLRHVTAVGGAAPLGSQLSGAMLTVQASVFGGSASGQDCQVGTVVSRGFNLESSTSCNLLDPTDGQGITDLRIGPLRDNGGLTPTHMPLFGSPLIDVFERLPDVDTGSIQPLRCDSSVESDQRGEWVVDRDGSQPSGSRHRPYVTTGEDGLCDVGAVEATYPRHGFVDVGAEVEQAVRWITARHHEPRLMTGNGSSFRPGAPISRAEAVRVLYRMAGSPAPTQPSGLVDVPPWVRDAVDWAVAEGLMTGYPDKTFRPNATISRGETLRLLFRTSGATVSEPYPRIPADTPPWLLDAARWGVPAGVIGPQNGGLGATAETLRATIVLGLHRMSMDPSLWGDPSAAPSVLPFRA